MTERKMKKTDVFFKDVFLILHDKVEQIKSKHHQNIL